MFRTDSVMIADIGGTARTKYRMYWMPLVSMFDFVAPKFLGGTERMGA